MRTRGCLFGIAGLVLWSFALWTFAIAVRAISPGTLVSETDYGTQAERTFTKVPLSATGFARLGLRLKSDDNLAPPPPGNLLINFRVLRIQDRYRKDEQVNNPLAFQEVHLRILPTSATKSDTGSGDGLSLSQPWRSAPFAVPETAEYQVVVRIIGSGGVPPDGLMLQFFEGATPAVGWQRFGFASGILGAMGISLGIFTLLLSTRPRRSAQ